MQNLDILDIGISFANWEVSASLLLVNVFTIKTPMDIIGFIFMCTENIYTLK